MDLYMTEKDTGTKIALSLLPDSVKTKANSNFISYNFISVGADVVALFQYYKKAAELVGKKAKDASEL